MLFNPQAFVAAPLTLVMLMATVIIGKALIVGAVTLLLGYPVRTALISGLTLAQVGEFSFVVSRAGDAYGLFDTYWNQLFLGTAVGTMALTPTLITLAPRFAVWVENTLPSKWTLRTDKQGLGATDQPRLEDHVIIVGFGMVGQNLARVLQYVDVPFIVIDLNPQTVHKHRQEGIPIIYGDASRPEILEQACLGNSRVVVIAISDPPAAQRAVETIRRLHAGTHIIIRSRYFHESEPLYDLGANEVVPEEFEVSIEIFSRTLHHYLVPRGEIETYVRELRHEGYGVLRKPLPGEPAGPELHPFLEGSAFQVFEVEKESGAVGHTLSELELPAKFGITILAIRSSDGELNVAPGAQFQLESGDSLLVLGAPEALAAVGQECRLQRPE
jgi:CPA2 family monovalent cation:H+ antiporter-2